MFPQHSVGSICRRHELVQERKVYTLGQYRLSKASIQIHKSVSSEPNILSYFLLHLSYFIEVNYKQKN